MNELIFNLNQPYTIAIRQQWLPPGAANCMAFNFNNDLDVEHHIWRDKTIVYGMWGLLSL